MGDRIAEKLAKARKELERNMKYYQDARKEYLAAKEAGENKMELRKRQSHLTHLGNSIKHGEERVRVLESYYEPYVHEPTLEERVNILEEKVNSLIHTVHK